MTDQPTPQTEALQLAALRELAEAYVPGRDDSLNRMQLDQLRQAVIAFAAAAQARTEALDVKRTHEIGTDPHCDWCERYAAVLAAKADR